MNKNLNPQKDTPYLALKGELWGVFCEDFGENRPCYIGTALYLVLPVTTSWQENSFQEYFWLVGKAIPSQRVSNADLQHLLLC